jgi:hypothetical protein
MKTRKRSRSKGGAALAFMGTKKPAVLCQCVDINTKAGCQQTPLPGSLFCKEHQGCPGSPQSGYEPKFEPERYNKDPAIYRSHNCYSYSMNVLDPRLVQKCRRRNNEGCRQYFHQPGALKGDRFALNRIDRRTCPVVEKLQSADVKDIEKSDFYERCAPGKSKIALVVDPGEDYHYYRQDADGFWSHKDGSNKVKRFDALKRPIFNPELAARDYKWLGSDLNYVDFCGFYCVPRDHAVHLGQGGAFSGAQVAGQSWTTHRGGSSRRRRTRRRRL